MKTKKILYLLAFTVLVLLIARIAYNLLYKIEPSNSEVLSTLILYISLNKNNYGN